MKEPTKPPRARRTPTSSGRAAGRTTWLSAANIGIAVLVLIAGLVVYAFWQSYTAQTARAQPLEGLEEFPNQPAGHQDGALTYDPIPPVGGIHNGVWQNCGVYTTPIANENAVHSLEHGAAWITYQPDLAADQVAELQSITRQTGYRLLSPYPDLSSPIVVSAWGYQLKLERADDPRLEQFLQRYEQSPLAPEPGAACTSGTGQPQ